MGWFDPPWLKLHRRICNLYEQFACGDLAQNPEADIDIVGVMARVLEKELRLAAPASRKMADDFYATFRDFPVRSAFEDALRRQNPKIPDKGVDAIFLAGKKIFLDTPPEHKYFVYFVISYLLVDRNYGITRGDYFMKVCLNAIPEDKSLSKILRRTQQAASYAAAKERINSA
jgi:hypothetical protein